MVAIPVIPELGWNKDPMLEASLGYRGRPCFKGNINNNNNNNNNNNFSTL